MASKVLLRVSIANQLGYFVVRLFDGMMVSLLSLLVFELCGRGGSVVADWQCLSVVGSREKLGAGEKIGGT